MRSFSKYFSDAFASAPDIEPHKFLQIHGTDVKCCSSNITVELKLSAHLPFDILPALLFSIRSLYSSCNDSRYLLYLVIDAREGTLDAFHACTRALHNFASRLDGTIERILWVGVPYTINLDAIIANDLTVSRIQNTFCDLRNLPEHVDLTFLSTSLGGLVEPEVSEQFFRMRSCLEDLLRRTHRMAKLYMNLHEDLKKFDVPKNITELTIDAVTDRMEEGAVKRATTAFDELSAVMRKCESTINRRLGSFQSTIEMISFIEDLSKELSGLESRLAGVEKLKNLRTFNINRLSAQVKKAEELSTCENSKMNLIMDRLSEMNRLLEECCWLNETDRRVVERIASDVRDKISSARSRVLLTVDVLKKALEARNLIDQLYDWALLHAKKQCDESAKQILIEQFPSDAVSHLRQYIDLCSDPPIRQEIETLVHDCENAMCDLTSSEPKTDMSECEGTKRCADELQISESKDSQVSLIAATSEVTLVAETTDAPENTPTFDLDNVSEKSTLENIPQQCDNCVSNYNNVVQSNEQISQKSDNVKRAEVAESEPVNEMANSDSCLGAEMDSSVPGSSLAKSRSDLSDSISDTPMEIFSDVEESLMASCSRMLSMNMTPPSRHHSVSPAPTQYEIPISKASVSSMEPLKIEKDEDEVIRWRRNSWCSTIAADDSPQFEEHAIGAAPVTLNLTDKVFIFSFSLVITTMSSSTLSKRLDQRRSVSSVPLRLPNPFLINGSARPGSARFVTAKSRPVLSRNSTIDLFDQESLSNAFQFLDDDYSVSGEPVSNAPSAGEFYNRLRNEFHSEVSLSTLDFSMRSEQIEVIRDWLNPAKTSDPNNRIECTVVRDLLDTEIDYVSTLRLIVQDFVPELARVDIPSALRGKKFRLFGNIERLFQFHAHSFLPHLISRLRFRTAEESLSLTIGRLFIDHATHFNLYSLYAKNKPKSDELMRECGSDFFHSIQNVSDLSPLLVRPIERIGKYTLALQQLLNAAPPNKLEVLQILEKAVNVVSRQIRHGSDLLAMEHITGCDLNLREQGALIRNDTMLVTEKKGLHSRKRLRSVFLFENCVVLTKPKLCKSSKRSGIYNELRYKGSIQMTDCGLTEMVKDSKVKFELWFRKQTNSFTYILEAQSPSVRDAWVSDIRGILWKQAIRSREESLREKANMGMEACVNYIHLGINSPMGLGMLREKSTLDVARRPRSLISLTASSCSSSNNTRIPNISSAGCEMSDLCRVEESDETDALVDDTINRQNATCSLPRFRAPPPPDTNCSAPL
ncbi:unnamed protein product [Anisakis simplex]|uniref:CRAL-TRIO domain-containing protein n=1 Tax=Anisakis simplex TaxID=6269 RepID=A0A0M3JQZ0_ANISI|nr:unnamed protein product [Anisakis simplex]